MKPALQTLEVLGGYIPKALLRNKEISDWSIGMQIEHCLIATSRICDSVTESEPSVGKVKKSITRRLIFLTGTIPRGRGKAPERSYPSTETNEFKLLEMLSAAHSAVEKAAEVNQNCWWEHMYFGVMKRDDALRFIEIHNKHHLKIIADILASPEKTTRIA